MNPSNNELNRPSFSESNEYKIGRGTAFHQRVLIELNNKMVLAGGYDSFIYLYNDKLEIIKKIPTIFDLLTGA